MELLPKAYDATAAVLATVTDWEAQSPCAEWTVREVANHLVEALTALVASVDGGDSEVEVDDPLGAFRVAADRSLTVFSRPDVLAATHPFVFGPTTGSEIAEISLSEALVHGWDIARGAGVPYDPAPEVVAHVLARSAGSPSSAGLFAPPVPVPPGAPPLTVLLGRLGRTA